MMSIIGVPLDRAAALTQSFRVLTRVQAYLRLTVSAAAIVGASAAFAASGQPSPEEIIRQSMIASARDWAASPHYDYFDRTQTSDGVRTSAVTMILGTPYERLVSIDDRPLSAADASKEEKRLAREVAKRTAESPSQRADRVAEYHKTREQAHQIIEEMPRAFEYRVASTKHTRGRTVYVLHAKPRAGYDAPNAASKVLTGMEGEFWIDTATYQWVHASARVLTPVSIAGFLVKVQPGTRFELDQMPIEDDVWLPSHYEIRSRSSILFLFRHRMYEEHTYFNYQKSGALAYNGGR
jgi:hypothetical protein